MSDDGNTSSRLARLLVVAAWIALAIAANVVLALTPSRDTGSTLLPRDAQTVAANHRIGQAFPGTGTDAIAYLVLDGRDPLGPAEQQYYDAAVNALRADTAHVGSVLDLWADPLMAPLGASADGRSGTALLWLRGEAGTEKAAGSLDAARSVLRKIAAPAGLRARITVPAAATGTPLRLAAWQAVAIVAAAAVLAVACLLRAGRSARSVCVALLSAGLSLAVAWPLAAAFGWFTGAVAGVLMIGVIAAATLLTTRQDRGRYRAMLPALALPGACVLALTGPLLLARTPAVHGVGLAALSVVVALGASLTLLPVLIGGSAEQPTRSAGWRPPFSVPRPAVVVALVLALCALPVLGTHWGISPGPDSARTGHFVASNRLPDVVLVKSTHDLRDPAGLIAIDAASRRLMEIPGVRKVQSAAWPGGTPWADASLSSAAGRLSEQLDRQAATFVPQVTAIKTLATVLDQVSGSVNELEASVTAGVGGLTQMQQAIDTIVAGTRNIKDTTSQVSGYLDPVRRWMGGFPDCATDVLCRAASKAIDPIDRVVSDVTVLADGADRIAAGSSRTAGALTATPHAVAQIRSALTQLRSFVPSLETTIESSIPQIVQLSAFLKYLSIDFADTGEGGFYLPRKALADPSYQHVRQTMFSADGTAARLFVYSDSTRLGPESASRAHQLEAAVGNATKYGALADSEISVSGGAQVAASVHDAVRHDGILLAVTLLAVAALVGVWRGLGGAVAVGLGLVGSWLAGVGLSVAVWQYLLHRSLDLAAAPASFAVLAACGVPYLVAALLRRSVTPLPVVGAVVGAGLIMVGSVGTLGQIGAIAVIGLLGVAAVARVCVPLSLR